MLPSVNSIHGRLSSSSATPRIARLTELLASLRSVAERVWLKQRQAIPKITVWQIRVVVLGFVEHTSKCRDTFQKVVLVARVQIPRTKRLHKIFQVAQLFGMVLWNCLCRLPGCADGMMKNCHGACLMVLVTESESEVA